MTGKSMKEAPILLIGVALILAVAWCRPLVAGECGRASHYGFESGTKTATGEHFNPNGLTTASRSLPFGTILVVTMRDPHPEMRRWYGKKVRVRVNDRGPYHRDKRGNYDRFLDLSDGAARLIGLTHAGVARVCAERLK